MKKTVDRLDTKTFNRLQKRSLKVKKSAFLAKGLVHNFGQKIQLCLPYLSGSN